jgi:release factor glutamine methyltransferase
MSLSEARTVAEAIRAATAILGPRTDTARLDAELLMAEALGTSRSDLFLRRMSDSVPGGFAGLVARRAAHEPVAYIRGQQQFFGLEFEVSPAVLIPRGDSEVLIEVALAQRPAARRVLDCGTGSGALLLAVLANLDPAEGVGIDRSAAALTLARRNARQLGLANRARLIERDWHQPGWSDDLGQFDLILANPPYVETVAPLARSVREYEPAGALFAGPEGLDDYRVLIPQLPGLLAPGGLAVVEIGFAQADAVGQLAQAAGLLTELHHDLGARPRALALQIPLGKAGRSR